MDITSDKIVNLIMKIEEEDIIVIRGKTFLIKPLEANDIDRVIKCMD